MNTARRRQQGYRVNKREIQDPLSSFAQNGMKTQGDPTPESVHLNKSKEARDFLKLLYSDNHTRNIINRNLRYDDDLSEQDPNNPDRSIGITPHMWLQRGGADIDVSQDVPSFATPVLADFLKTVESGRNIPNKELDDVFHHYGGVRDVEGFDGSTLRLIGNLKNMYPERENTLMSFKGLSDTYADLMSDFSASMGNMKFSDDDEGSSGYVFKDDFSGVKENPFYKDPDTMEDSQYLKGRSVYYPRQENLGFKEKPLVMGMGKYQNRMNEAIQIDPNQDVSTFIHEMTHAGDIEENSFNTGYINDVRYEATKTGSEQNEMLMERSWDYAMNPEDWFYYVTKPTETLARLNVLRYGMYKHFGSEDSPYKQEDFVNYTYGTNPRKEASILNSDESVKIAYDDLKSVYGEDVIIDMLNNVY